MEIKNWSIVSGGDSYVAPELSKYRLLGKVYENPFFEDGREVTTSRIVKIRDKGTHKEVITQSGSVYKVYKDEVNHECEELFPDYYNRLKLTYNNESNNKVESYYQGASDMMKFMHDYYDGKEPIYPSEMEDIFVKFQRQLNN